MGIYRCTLPILAINYHSHFSQKKLIIHRIMRNKVIYWIFKAIIVIILTPALNLFLTEVIGKDSAMVIIGLIYVCIFLYIISEIFIKEKNNKEKND